VKPNPARSIYDLLAANWTLTGDLDLAHVDFIVERRATTQTNRPTILIQLGDTMNDEEGLPIGVSSSVQQEVFVSPTMPNISGMNDQMWSMSREIQRIVKTNRTSASGIEYIWIEDSPRTGGSQEPYRGSDVIITCFWRE
jgi:hypothetical protein